jgi:hypothetical protein
MERSSIEISGKNRKQRNSRKETMRIKRNMRLESKLLSSGDKTERKK